MGIGNHCTSVINHHHTNPVKRLIEKMNDAPDRKKLPQMKYAGYSGFARFRFDDGKGAGAKQIFNLLYHHGAWGGHLIKGKGGAQRWADRIEPWDVMVYGHNHACHMDMIPKLSMNSSGKIVDRTQFIVNTGTFLRGLTQGGSPAYSEIKGYPAVALAAPLIKVTPRIRGLDISVEIGDC